MQKTSESGENGCLRDLAVSTDLVTTVLFFKPFGDVRDQLFRIKQNLGFIQAQSKTIIGKSDVFVVVFGRRTGRPFPAKLPVLLRLSS
jgi:hypothetical protein